MADNKNQHFVPRAHLKFFSADGDGKVINLYNLDRSRIIRNAPVRHQCARDYFYGQNERLEQAIQLVEATYARCVKSLHEPRIAIEDIQVMALRRFTYLQYLRTEAAARRSAELMPEMMSAGEANVEQPKFKEAVRDAVLVAMKTFAETMRVVDDLKVRIVRNLTSDPFITSDDPAVLCNRWHQSDARARHRSFGIVSAGALLFLPLSPILLAILFDKDVYTTESARGWIDVSDSADVAACNDQQVLNCAANLYFGDAGAESYVQARVDAVAHLRPTRRFQTVTAVAAGGTGTHFRYKVVDASDLRDAEEILVHTRLVHPVPARWPTFLKFRTGRFVFTNDTGAGFRRRMTAESGILGSPPWRKVRG